MTDSRQAFEKWAAQRWGADAWRHTSDCDGEWDAFQAGVAFGTERAALAVESPNHNLAQVIRNLDL